MGAGYFCFFANGVFSWTGRDCSTIAPAASEHHIQLFFIESFQQKIVENFQQKIVENDAIILSLFTLYLSEFRDNCFLLTRRKRGDVPHGTKIPLFIEGE